MVDAIEWPKRPTYWMDGNIMCVSIPFTWNLKEVHDRLSTKDFLFDEAWIGGPATKLMKDFAPGFFDDLPHVTVKESYPGAMQIVNPQATKTTTGCIRSCGFCAVPRMEGKITELLEWPDLPVICDNNLLGTSVEHFDRVIDRLKVHGWADFNQGIDSRLLTDYHAKRLREIGRPMIRLALDSMAYVEQWEVAFDRLRSAGFPKSMIRSYALIAFEDNPTHTVDEAWKRCEYIDTQKGIVVLPMWYHRLDALEPNTVTDGQKVLGWNDYERRKIMQWYYQHKKAVA